MVGGKEPSVVYLAGNDDFSAGFFKFGDEVGGGLRIGDDGVDRVESAEGGDGAAIELGVIQTKNDPLSRLEHGLLNVD